MKNDTTICVATFSSELEADMARMNLDSNGSDSFVSKDDCGGMRPWLQSITGVRLIVRKSEAKQAFDILEKTKNRTDKIVQQMSAHYSQPLSRLGKCDSDVEK